MELSDFSVERSPGLRSGRKNIRITVPALPKGDAVYLA